MITVIDGLAGSGKTWFMTKLLYRAWRQGSFLWVNYPVYFSGTNDDITRYHQLDELYHLKNGIIGIDEGQKLFDARRWSSLPASFAEKIAGHRHDHLDIITTTQDLGHIDARIRQNIHQLYKCQSVFRWPRDERKKPIIQLIRIAKKIRRFNNDTERIVWTQAARPKLYFLSMYWTKTLYDTYTSIYLDRYVCKLKLEKTKQMKRAEWSGKIYSREMVNQGKARL